MYMYNSLRTVDTPQMGFLTTISRRLPTFTPLAKERPSTTARLARDRKERHGEGEFDSRRVSDRGFIMLHLQ